MSKRLTKDEFIDRSNKIHSDKYNYSLVDYENCETKVKIICQIHGIFEQTPIGHLNGRGCCSCYGNNLWTNEKYINECKKIHGNKYDYSKTRYISQQKKVIIICRIHGYFKQWAQHHLRKGVGCPKCAGKINTKEFIEKANIIHKNKYIYLKTFYKNMKNMVLITCPTHGEFEQIPQKHIDGTGCPRCNGRNKNNQEIINEFRNIHGNKYDYSKLNYTTSKGKLTIICQKHGEFEQIYNNHLKSGCPKCSGKYKTLDSLIEEFKNIHGDKYDYSDVIYEKAKDKIKIICSKHGEFLQTVNSHLRGCGCSKCNYSKGEIKIEKILIENNINYETQKYLEGCKNKLPLKFDFFLQDRNTCIEFDGEQHYKKYHFENNNDRLESTKKRDKIKTNFCLKNDIKLIRIKYNENIEEKLKCLTISNST